MATTSAAVTLPFGRHKGTPLLDLPTSYLVWALRECRLSSGLRAAVAGELARRGVEVPEAPPPRPVRPCADHPTAGVLVHWFQDRLGRRRIRTQCRRCHRAIDHPPIREPYISMADAVASATPVLDVLTRLDDLGVEIVSDGRAVWVSPSDWRRVPAQLHAVLRQCSYQLARLLGDTRKRG